MPMPRPANASKITRFPIANSFSDYPPTIGAMDDYKVVNVTPT
jgi:hypothetical protein